LSNDQTAAVLADAGFGNQGRWRSPAFSPDRKTQAPEHGEYGHGNQKQKNDLA
jgi:hypothetical protein